MGYTILNAIPNQTIKDINTNFNMALSKNTRRVMPIISNTWNENRELSQLKRLMEDDDEVQYNKNTY